MDESPHMNPEGEGTWWRLEAPIDPPYEGIDVFPFVTIQPDEETAIERLRWQVDQLDREIVGEIEIEETTVDEVAEFEPSAPISEGPDGCIFGPSFGGSHGVTGVGRPRAGHRRPG